MQRSWIEESRSLSLIREEIMSEVIANQIDSEYHEYLEDDIRFSSLFVDHDPSQCVDHSQEALDWKKFTEDQDTSAHTITGSDLPEDIQEMRTPKIQKSSPMAIISNATLKQLASLGDTQAARILQLKQNLLNQLGIRILFYPMEKANV